MTITEKHGKNNVRRHVDGVNLQVHGLPK